MTKNYNKTENVLPLPTLNVETSINSVKPADFETAITATGFGKFNILLILISIPSGWSSIFETTTMSYVFPAAQCDLSLTLANKGFLNAVTYIGMICSAFIWGFLCDTLGRRKLLSIGLFLDGVFVLMSATSQNVTLLFVAKFLGGFMSATHLHYPKSLTTYLSEFHCARHRARIQMMLGIIFSCGSVILPLLAWAVLPVDLSVILVNNSIEFHSWNLYLCVCAIPALTGGMAFVFMPESPKFLMTAGKNKQALAVFKKVYSLNTGNPPDSFPIKELIEEGNSSKSSSKVLANRTKIQAVREGWHQMRPLFFPPHLAKIILVCFMQMFTMMSLNTLRLWLPQIFQAINDYRANNNGNVAPLCTMLEELTPSNRSEGCVVNMDNSSVYINSIIVASVTIFGYVLAGILINALGKKKLLNSLGVVCGLSAMCMYWAQNSITTIILSSLFVALGSICINVMLAVVVDLFPTTLRTMTISLTMMLGRSGAMMGNLVFPTLLQLGCAPPFFSVGAVIIMCGFLSCILPNTDMKALQ